MMIDDVNLHFFENRFNRWIPKVDAVEFRFRVHVLDAAV